jgi:hypothetical protein
MHFSHPVVEASYMFCKHPHETVITNECSHSNYYYYYYYNYYSLRDLTKRNTQLIGGHYASLSAYFNDSHWTEFDNI